MEDTKKPTVDLSKVIDLIPPRPPSEREVNLRIKESIVRSIQDEGEFGINARMLAMRVMSDTGCTTFGYMQCLADLALRGAIRYGPSASTAQYYTGPKATINPDMIVLANELLPAA